MGPSREACDRCHSMKTRCVRAPNTQICNRCNRLGVSCNYSPAGRTGRPLGSSRRARAASTTTTTTTTNPGSAQSRTHRESTTPPSRAWLCSLTVPFPAQADLHNTLTTPTTADQAGDTVHALDFFAGAPHHPEDDGISDSFMDSFAFDDGYPLNLCNPSHSHFDPSSLTSSTDPTLVNVGERDGDASLPDSIDPVEEDDRFHRLLEMQTRLAKLVKSLAGGLNGPEDIEDTYRSSETLIDILTAMDQPLQRPAQARPNGAVILLLSSCYFTLVHAYELLAGLLRDELCKSPQSASKSRLPDPVNLDAQSDSSQDSMPGISIGAVRLAMPRQAVAAVNLHLITRIVQHVKDTMQQFAARMAAAQGQNLPAGAPTHSARNSLDKDASKCDAIVYLAETAQSELRQREENLLTHLRTSSASSLDTGWNESR